MAKMYAPRLMLMYFGQSPAMSIPVDTELRRTLIDSCAAVHPRPAKKTAARTAELEL